MTNTEPDAAAYVDHLSQLLDLPIPPEYHAGVVANFARFLPIAKQVMEFPLSQDSEVAPTFQP
jgi:hypothetical protein